MSLALAAVAAAALAVPASAAQARDDTAWLQARLDLGGEVYLAPLPDGECYATRGLWIWRDDTSLVSDGACLVSLGSGPVRLHAGDMPIAADGVVYVNRTDGETRPPARIRIAGIRIDVPARARSYAIEVQGRDVELDHVTVTGTPKDALLVGGYGNGDGYASDVFVHDSVFAGGARNVISVTGVRGLTITRCVVTGASDTAYVPETKRSYGNPAAGIDVEPDNPGNPIVGAEISDSWIGRNAGPGVEISLKPQNHRVFAADGIRIVRNRIVENGQKKTPPIQGGVVVAGGEIGGRGHLEIAYNVIGWNRGFGLRGNPVGGTSMVVNAHDNVFRRNTAGRWSFVGLGLGSRLG